MNQHDLDHIASRIGEAARQYAPAYRPTPRQSADACALLRDMLAAVAIHGVTFADFDAVADFPRMAIQLVQHRDTSA
ncbi:hypothetical protein [Streptomyces triticagri]|uniref:hypothetical protein n=1 Tax=Streptomyces triticagri TaxID=2293568 RepID=UPI001F1FB625|nr:hypothetical protein [Streptomyces triticagri]